MTLKIFALWSETDSPLNTKRGGGGGGGGETQECGETQEGGGYDELMFSN
jgi:hypothetical protein